MCIGREVLDVEAYYQGCPVERIPPASAQRVGTAVGHFTDPWDVRGFDRGQASAHADVVGDNNFCHCGPADG